MSTGGWKRSRPHGPRHGLVSFQNLAFGAILREAFLSAPANDGVLVEDPWRGLRRL